MFCKGADSFKPANCYSWRKLQKEGGSQLYPTTVNVSSRSDEKKHGFLLPPKCLFSVCFCSKWQGLHARKYTLQTYTVLTWLTFHLRILSNYKKIDTFVAKKRQWCKIAAHLCLEKVKTVCILSTLVAKNGCQNKSVFPFKHSAEYIFSVVQSFISFISLNIRSNSNFLFLWRPKIFIHYNSSLL